MKLHLNDVVSIAHGVLRVEDHGNGEIIKAAAARFDAQVIDGRELVPHDATVFADLRLHPNALGFEFLRRGATEEIA